MPAIVFADQSKAFERLSHTWVDESLSLWNMPPWIHNSPTALIQGRSAVTNNAGTLGKPRLLRCGVGMGGPCSPCLWSIGYDPIIEGLATSLDINTPTYVDDLAGLVFGPQ